MRVSIAGFLPATLLMSMYSSFGSSWLSVWSATLNFVEQEPELLSLNYLDVICSNSSIVTYGTLWQGTGIDGGNHELCFEVQV